MLHNKRGFTLLELLTVVLIIGILSAIAVPQYTKSVRRAEMVEGLANGKTLYDSAVRYRAINGDAPSDLSQVDAAFIGMDNFSGTSADDGNFTYELPNTWDRVRVTSNKGDYYLDFVYPVTNSDGTFAPIGCCPKRKKLRPGEENISWVCQNAGKETTSSYIAGCREIAY